ncbi:hypothetical protein [Halotia branconii]|uniref:Late competence development ComFB family protein n=1 Tax=Halotia branconii CENA392 TaxID=1539056 RepID=A0AAJ6P850_9CYAN|nr:hypothetical protein [Halotia branconii]WGV24267.1 hypothetical protein QI031_21070 [Halotia branconii CENA392]
MKTVVNLTQQSVIGEIENVLDTYPHHPYQQAFAIPDLRQELVAFVLSRIPCLYSAVSAEQISLENLEKEECSINHRVPRSALEQQIHLQNLIHQGIYTLFREKSDWISHHLCETVQPDSEPSHWFG